MLIAAYLLLPAIVFALMYLLTGRKYFRSEKWREKGKCPICGYDLRASTDRCPECGTPIATGFSLLNFIAPDGSRHFGELPRSTVWYDVRDHVSKLAGATLTAFVCDGVTEAWIDFVYAGHSFSINDQCGSYWFFVETAECPDEVLQAVLNHFEQLLCTAPAASEGPNGKPASAT